MKAILAYRMRLDIIRYRRWPKRVHMWNNRDKKKRLRKARKCGC